MPHYIIEKIFALGFCPSFIKLLSCYLDDRTQCVEINAKVSSTMLVTSGVPQGSILGPSLFVIYINNLPDDIVFGDCFLFAGKKKFLCASLQLNCDIQADVTIFKNWAGQNLMNFDTAKCQVIRFSNNPASPLTKH